MCFAAFQLTVGQASKLTSVKDGKTFDNTFETNGTFLSDFFKFINFPFCSVAIRVAIG